LRKANSRMSELHPLSDTAAHMRNDILWLCAMAALTFFTAGGCLLWELRSVKGSWAEKMIVLRHGFLYLGVTCWFGKAFLALIFVFSIYNPDGYNAPDHPMDYAAYEIVSWSLAALFLLAATTVLWIARRHHGDTDRNCASCGYSLVGNTSGICPECGTSAVEGVTESSCSDQTR